VIQLIAIESTQNFNKFHVSNYPRAKNSSKIAFNPIKGFKCHVSNAISHAEVAHHQVIYRYLFAQSFSSIQHLHTTQY
jgi:hydroxymethylglutaryl-CoA reductase